MQGVRGVAHVVNTPAGGTSVKQYVSRIECVLCGRESFHEQGFHRIGGAVDMEGKQCPLSGRERFEDISRGVRPSRRPAESPSKLPPDNWRKAKLKNKPSGDLERA